MVSVYVPESSQVHRYTGRKNIQKYAPLYYPEYNVEILNQEKFVFSISYSQSISDLAHPDKLQHELKPGLQKEYDIEAMGKEIKAKLGLSWDQVGTKSGLSWHQVEKLMCALESPHAIKELMKLLDWKNRTKFRGRFINPLIDIGVISMTIPDKPNSPNQQYYLSQKGSILLAALKNRDSLLLIQY